MKAAVSFTILVCLAAVMYFSAETSTEVANDNLESSFMSFVSEYGKVYTNKAEYTMRLGIYKKNSDWIAEENQKGHSHTLAMNHFGDWTDAEFEKTLGMQNSERAVRTGPAPEMNFNGPADFDWSTMGDGTAIHDVED